LNINSWYIITHPTSSSAAKYGYSSKYCIYGHNNDIFTSCMATCEACSILQTSIPCNMYAGVPMGCVADTRLSMPHKY